MSKSIKITESQYKRLLLSEDLDSACEFTGGNYNSNGSYVIKTGNKEYLFGKNKSKKYADYYFGAIKEPNGKFIKFFYNCKTNKIFYGNINNKILTLSDEIKNIKSVSSNKETGEINCLKRFSRLNTISKEITTIYDFVVKNDPTYGCQIIKNGLTDGGVEYKIIFTEKPNYYNIILKSKDNKFKLLPDTFISNTIAGESSLTKLFSDELDEVIFTGKYSLGELGNLGVYNIEYNSINGKIIKVIDKGNYDDIFWKIINSFGVDDYKPSEELQIKNDPISYSANNLHSLIDGWTSEEDFIDINKEVVKYDCKEMAKINVRYKKLYNADLWKDIDESVYDSDWTDYKVPLVDYVKNPCNKSNYIDTIKKGIEELSKK